MNDTNQILQELKVIRNEIRSIKENMPDREMFLTTEEGQLLLESYEHEKRRELISGNDLRREIEI